VILISKIFYWRGGDIYLCICIICVYVIIVKKNLARIFYFSVFFFFFLKLFKCPYCFYLDLTSLTRAQSRQVITIGISIFRIWFKLRQYIHEIITCNIFAFASSWGQFLSVVKLSFIYRINSFVHILKGILFFTSTRNRFRTVNDMNAGSARLARWMTSSWIFNAPSDNFMHTSAVMFAKLSRDLQFWCTYLKFSSNNNKI